MHRRCAIKALAAGVLLASGLTAGAQDQYPSKPIRLIVPYSAGGGALDVVVRLLGDQLTASLKQPVIIDNRPGGGTTLGAGLVAREPADGHTLFVNAASFVITAQLMPNLPYDPQKDFVPITMTHSYPHVLVTHPGTKTETARDFIKLAKEKGGTMAYASFGNGSSGHLSFEGVKKTFGFDMTHVAYKGSAPAMTDVMAGRLAGMMADLPAAIPYFKSGKLVPLALASDKRSPNAPDIPTFEEATGTKFVSRSWFGILVRSGTPPEVQQVLNRVIVGALRKPEVSAKLREFGADVHATTGEEFATFMKAESVRFAEAIKFSGATME